MPWEAILEDCASEPVVDCLSFNSEDVACVLVGGQSMAVLPGFQLPEIHLTKGRNMRKRVVTV